MRHAAWLVDLDGTLYHALPVKLMMGVELLLFGRAAIRELSVFRQQHERIRAEMHEPVADPFALQLERTADEVGRTRESLERTVREWMIRRPCRWIHRFRRRSLLREIVAFRAAGGKTALVSDYPAREKLEALTRASLFDAVVANGEAPGPGRLKPWPDGYELAARNLGVEPARCLVIGDRIDADGEAARRAGMAFRCVPGGSEPRQPADGEQP